MERPGHQKRLPLAITLGEPAGIGPEIILKAWLGRHQHALLPFAVVGGAAHLEQLATSLKLDVPVHEVGCDEVEACFTSALPVIPLEGEALLNARPGHSSSSDSMMVCGSIETAAAGCLEGIFGGMVTAPINKKALYDAGFEFPGHTEFLAALARQSTGEAHHPVMMLAGPELRTVPVTIHIPLGEVPKALNAGVIAKTIWITAHDLTVRLGIRKPRIAVSGLNPHAGENGALGEEDSTIIEPAIAACMMQGIDVRGPLPADTMFHASARQTYDVAICMYHDQALIPAKTLAFDEAVNVTLGLPFIRTSPDHGTAYDIAGKGVANPSSMIAAIQMAGEMAAFEHTHDQQGMEK